MAFSYAQLEGLWIQAGGSQAQAPLMAAIALAESGGNPNATNHNSNGTVDEGLWQINTVWGSLQTFDPLGNAKAAVTILGKQGIHAWSTFNNGAYKKFLNGAVPPDTNGLNGGGGGGAPGGGGSTTMLIDVTGNLLQFLQWAIGGPPSNPSAGQSSSTTSTSNSGTAANSRPGTTGTGSTTATAGTTPALPVPGATGSAATPSRTG